MTSLRVLQSSQDRSINFVEEALTGFLEARYVRKDVEKQIIYLSSQTGCNRGCTFCHLTATGQTSFIDASVNDFLGQAMQAFKHYRKQEPAKYLHYNFMARGEPLASQVLTTFGTELLTRLGDMARNEGLPCKFNISTIMPLTLKKSLVEIFPYITPTIYYSLYSTSETWRKKWMPGAMPVPEAVRLLKEYQSFSKKIIKIHHPLIAGENDSETEALEIGEALRGLYCEFNLVRYNPASPEQGTESDDWARARYLNALENGIAGKIQVIPRVGFDVKASCGMFQGATE